MIPYGQLEKHGPKRQKNLGRPFVSQMGLPLGQRLYYDYSARGTYTEELQTLPDLTLE